MIISGFPQRNCHVLIFWVIMLIDTVNMHKLAGLLEMQICYWLSAQQIVGKGKVCLGLLFGLAEPDSITVEISRIRFQCTFIADLFIFHVCGLHFYMITIFLCIGHCLLYMSMFMVLCTCIRISGTYISIQFLV